LVRSPPGHKRIEVNRVECGRLRLLFFGFLLGTEPFPPIYRMAIGSRPHGWLVLRITPMRLI